MVAASDSFDVRVQAPGFVVAAVYCGPALSTMAVARLADYEITGNHRYQKVEGFYADGSPRQEESSAVSFTGTMAKSRLTVQ